MGCFRLLFRMDRLVRFGFIGAGAFAGLVAWDGSGKKANPFPRRVRGPSVQAFDASAYHPMDLR